LYFFIFLWAVVSVLWTLRLARPSVFCCAYCTIVWAQLNVFMYVFMGT